MRLLYEVNSASLLRSLLSWTRGDTQAAEDLVQETMLRAWRNLDALHEDPSAVRPWLLTVSRRLAIDALRARAARPNETRDTSLALIPDASRPFEQVLDREVLREAMVGLSQMHRTVVAELYITHRTVRETAQLIGIPEGTVKSRAHHALRALREAIDLPKPGAVTPIADARRSGAASGRGPRSRPGRPSVAA